MTATLSGAKEFPRELRLLTPSHFSYVFSDAIPASTQYLTFLARYNQTNTPRLGITVAKKRVRTAVKRNRIKRLIRESFRHHAHQLPNVDIIVVVKSGCDTLSNEELFTLMEKTWRRLNKKCLQQKT
jgi:ribonuclease P protein component